MSLCTSERAQRTRKTQTRQTHVRSCSTGAAASSRSQSVVRSPVCLASSLQCRTHNHSFAMCDVGQRRGQLLCFQQHQLHQFVDCTRRSALEDRRKHLMGQSYRRTHKHTHIKDKPGFANGVVIFFCCFGWVLSAWDFLGDSPAFLVCLFCLVLLLLFHAQHKRQGQRRKGTLRSEYSHEEPQQTHSTSSAMSPEPSRLRRLLRKKIKKNNKLIKVCLTDPQKESIQYIRMQTCTLDHELCQKATSAAEHRRCTKKRLQMH